MSTTQERNGNTGRGWIENVRDLVAIVGGITAIVAAVLWIFGWQYAKGYYGAMNIPSSQVNLTLSDYGEMGWRFLIVLILVSCILIYTFYHRREHARNISERGRVIRSLISLVLLALGCVLIVIGTTDTSSDAAATHSLALYGGCILALSAIMVVTDGDNPTNRAIEVASIVLIISFIFFLTLFLANDLGVSSSKNYATQSTVKVRIILGAPLLVGVPADTQSIAGGNTLTVYEDFYLLLYNDGRYFLFRDIAPNCQPAQVYVVRDADVRSIDYIASSSDLPRPKCVPANNVQPSPTPNP